MTPRVDIHSHLILPALLGAAGELGPEIVYHEDGSASLRVGARYTKLASVNSLAEEKTAGPRAAAEKFLRRVSDPLTRVAEMDEKRIDILGVTTIPQFYFYRIDAPVARRFHSIANDALAEYCAAAPSRLFFMVTLPLQDLDASAAELGRAVELGARGVHLGAHSLAGMELYDDALWPLYARIEEAGIPLFIHPYPFELAGVPPTRFAGPMLEFPYQASVAAANLILSGALDDFPGLNVCISHGGGFLPYQFGRIETFAKLIPSARAKRPLREYLSQLYFDNLVHDVRARKYLVDWMGAANVVVGDNYAGMDSADGFLFLDELGLDATANEQISGANAVKLFGL